MVGLKPQPDSSAPPALDISTLSPAEIFHRMASSPLCNPELRDTAPAVEPLHTDEHTAIRRLVWKTDQGTEAIRIQLAYDDGRDRFVPTLWGITDVTPYTS